MRNLLELFRRAALGRVNFGRRCRHRWRRERRGFRRQRFLELRRWHGQLLEGGAGRKSRLRRQRLRRFWRHRRGSLLLRLNLWRRPEIFKIHFFVKNFNNLKFYNAKKNFKAEQVCARYLEGDKIPTKIGLGRVGIGWRWPIPDLPAMSGWIGIGHHDFSNFRGKSGKVLDNPDFSQFFSWSQGESGLSSTFPNVLGQFSRISRQKVRVNQGKSQLFDLDNQDHMTILIQTIPTHRDSLLIPISIFSRDRDSNPNLSHPCLKQRHGSRESLILCLVTLACP